MGFGVEIAAYVSLFLGYLLLLLLVVRRRDGRGRAQRLLEATLILAAVWTLPLSLLALLTSGPWWGFVWHRAAQLGLVALAVLTLELAYAFLQRTSHRWPWLGIAILFSVLAIGLDFLPIDLPLDLRLTPFLHLGRTELASLLLALAWVSYTVPVWWACVAALRRASSSKHLNRVRYLFIALAGFAVGDLLILIGGIPDVYVGLAARLLGFCVITFAVLRYDLPDIRRLLLNTVRLLLLMGVTATIYLLTLLIIGRFVSRLTGLSPLSLTIPTLLLAVLLGAAVDVAISPGLHRFLDRTIMGRAYDVQKALRAYSDRVSLILDSERLADTTLDWLRATMGVGRAAFILLTPQPDGQVELRVHRATIESVPEPKVFGANSRFLAHFYRHGRPLGQYDLDMLTWFQAMPDDQRRWLRDLALDLYIPILVADRPVALLALGPKAGKQPYSTEDLETLTILAGQTGTALENARLMDDLRLVQDDLHRLNNELAETNRQLARLDRAKTDFVTIASHELRTPLTQIYGYSDILARLEGEDLSNAQVVHEFIEGITHGAARLKQVVDAMVDVSLIDTGSLKIHPAMVPLQVIVDNAVETIRPALQERDLSLAVRDLADLPYIQADGSRLEQVVVGLLSNAVKFTPDGGEIVVSGRLDPSSPDGAWVELLVADTGIGVDADQQDLIFEKFYRAENPMLHSTGATRFKGAGPGLGLAIAKGIVEVHGGRIWVDSPGRNEATCPGSTFHVRLPITTPKG